MNIARASPFDYQNGRIRSSRRQLCWLYCDSMQIPPTAILQPIARTISSMVFPASTDRATNRKKRSIYRVLWGREDVETSFHCIVFHNSTLFIAFVISVNVNCCESLCHSHIRHRDTVRKSRNWNHGFRFDLDISTRCKRYNVGTNGSSGLYFFLEIRTISKNCPQFGLGQSQFFTANTNAGDGDIKRLKNYTTISRQDTETRIEINRNAL